MRKIKATSQRSQCPPQLGARQNSIVLQQEGPRPLRIQALICQVALSLLYGYHCISCCRKTEKKRQGQQIRPKHRYLKALFSKVERGEGDREEEGYVCLSYKISIIYTVVSKEKFLSRAAHWFLQPQRRELLLYCMSVKNSDLHYSFPLGTRHHPCRPAICLQIPLEDETLLQFRHKMSGWPSDSI